MGMGQKFGPYRRAENPLGNILLQVLTEYKGQVEHYAWIQTIPSGR